MNIYISGPITGMKASECKRAFNRAKREIKRRGHYPVSPVDLGKILPVSFEHEDYMAVDIQVLLRCDAVLMLPGWEKSHGCQRERFMAQLLITNNAHRRINAHSRINHIYYSPEEIPTDSNTL